MFYYISGMLAHREPGFAVIDCGGVGYRLTVSQNTLAALDRAGQLIAKVFDQLTVVVSTRAQHRLGGGETG